MMVETHGTTMVFHDAYSSEYCDSVMECFDKLEALGKTWNRQEKEKVSPLNKKDDSIYSNILLCDHEYPSDKMLEFINNDFDKTLWDVCYPYYAGEFAVLQESGHHNNYGSKVQKTKVGQGYHVWHYESGAREVSNRLLTYILYLNDVDEGGETEFLYERMRVKPKKGTLVLFPASFTHTHRGNPPLSNDKYIITGWIEF